MTVLLPLTAPALSDYAEGANINRAVSGLRSDAERRFLVLGLCTPECPHVVRHGAAPVELSQHSGFLFARNAKINRRLAMKNVGDNVCRCKLAFLSDAFTQDKIEIFNFSSDGLNGLYFIINDIETDMGFVSNELQQRKEG